MSSQEFTTSSTSIGKTWTKYIEEAGVIFCHAPGHVDKVQILCFEKGALEKDNYRLRNIPFPTDQPNFTEVQKAYKKLRLFILLKYQYFESDYYYPNFINENLISIKHIHLFPSH